MTKVTILGQEPKEKELKKIEFVDYLDINENKFKKNTHKRAEQPKAWENIVLIQRNFLGNVFDLMHAFDGDSSQHCLYLGHFNDGIV